MRCFSWPIMACQRDGEVEIFVGDILVEVIGRLEKKLEIVKVGRKLRVEGKERK